jgi:uncharacterized protein YkwD
MLSKTNTKKFVFWELLCISLSALLLISLGVFSLLKSTGTFSNIKNQAAAYAFTPEEEVKTVTVSSATQKQTIQQSTVYATSGAKYQVQGNRIIPLTGLYFFPKDSSKNLIIQLDTLTLPTQSTDFFLDTELSILIPFSNAVSFDVFESQFRSFIDLSSQTVVVKILDRSYVKGSKIQEIISSIRPEYAIHPFWTDFSIPEVTISNDYQSETNQNSVNLSFLSNKSGSLTVQNTEYPIQKDTALENITIPLTEGLNSITYFVSDSFDNASVTKNISITYNPCLGVSECGKCSNPACVVPEPVQLVQTGPISPSPTPTPIVVTPPPPAPVPTTVQPNATSVCDSSAFQSAFLTLINSYRVQNGVGALYIDSSLSIAACDHAIWMTNTGIFSHQGANGSYPPERCSNRGTTCYAENLAFSDPDNSATQMFDLFKSSPPHNATMLNGAYSAIGIALSSIYSATEFR